MEEVKQLSRRLERHTQAHQHSMPSTISFATIPLAPKLSLLYESPAMARPTSSHFTDRSSTIFQANEVLKNFNVCDLKVKFVPVHSLGIRKCSKTDRIMHTFNMWKEPEIDRKLHLVMSQKVKLVKFITKYFGGL